MKCPIRILELRSVCGIGGGPEKTILYGAAHADRQRFAVTVCYMRDERDAVFAIGAQAEKLGIDYVELRERHSFDYRVWTALRQLVRTRAIDIVHAHDYKTDFLAFALAQVEPVLPLATVHNWSGVSRRERIYYWFDKRLLARFPRLIAVSADTRRKLIQAGAPKHHIQKLLNGIDCDLFRRDPTRVPAARAAFELSADAFAIGTVGRLEAEKRLDLLLEAFANLRQRRANVRLLFAGQGSLKSTLEMQARQLGVADACRFLGHCSDVIGLHHALDLFVQSSDTEGTSNALLEAMALETPIVATAVGGTSELVTDAADALLIPPGDVAALAAAIERVIADPTATQNRRTAARLRAVTAFSFKARMQRVEAVYEEMLASAGRRGLRRLSER